MRESFRCIMRIPPLAKWNPKIDGLEDPGRWVLDWERSLLPHEMVSPRTGQIWEAVRDCEVSFMAWFTNRRPQKVANLRLNNRDRIRIIGVEDGKPLFVSFQPVRYRVFEGSLPEEIRNSPEYVRSFASLKTAKTTGFFQKKGENIYFLECFRLVEDSA